MKDLSHVGNFSKSLVAIGEVSIDPVWFYTDCQSSVLTLAAHCCAAFVGGVLELNLDSSILQGFSTSTGRGLNGELTLQAVEIFLKEDVNLLSVAFVIYV